MKLKIVFFILFIIFVIIGTISLIYKYIFDTRDNNFVPFSGGSFHINFVVNGGEKLSSMLVGIACSPDSYDNLPIPVRDGYLFEGWYYDEELTKKVEVTNSVDIKPVPRFDNKCQVGFEDIIIFAKWEKKNS